MLKKLKLSPNTDVITDENEPKDITQVLVCFLLHLRQNQLFHDLSNFRGEPVGEGERGRPFPVPFLLTSCMNAHASPNEHRPSSDPTDAVSSLGVVLGIVFAFSFAAPLLGAPITGLSSSRFLVRDVFG